MCSTERWDSVHPGFQRIPLAETSNFGVCRTNKQTGLHLIKSVYFRMYKYEWYSETYVFDVASRATELASSAVWFWRSGNSIGVHPSLSVWNLIWNWTFPSLHFTSLRVLSFSTVRKLAIGTRARALRFLNIVSCCFVSTRVD